MENKDFKSLQNEELPIAEGIVLKTYSHQDRNPKTYGFTIDSSEHKDRWFTGFGDLPVKENSKVRFSYKIKGQYYNVQDILQDSPKNPTEVEEKQIKEKMAESSTETKTLLTEPQILLRAKFIDLMCNCVQLCINRGHTRNEDIDLAFKYRVQQLGLAEEWENLKNKSPYQKS